MNFRVTIDVASEPVSLAEARLQCRLDSDDTSFDGALTSLITAARETCEHATGRALAPRTIEAAMDAFPSTDYFDLPLSPVTSVTSIKYDDANGTEQTLSTTVYALNPYGDARRVVLKANQTWPTTLCQKNAVRIVAVCGYAAIPKAGKDAILLDIEANSPNNPLTPQERADILRARDARLDTIKVYG